MDRTIRNGNLETSYSPEDFVNPDAFTNSEFEGKAFVFLNGGFVQAIVFAEYPAYTEQDALDEAADSGKLGDCLTQDELKEYETGEYSDVGNEHSPARKATVEIDGEETEVTIEHGGWPEYDSQVVQLGNASEPYDQEGWDIWVVSASVFAEDPCLMRPDRVMSRLEEWLNDAEREYKATPVDATEQGDATSSGTSKLWLERYRRVQDLEDTFCHCRLTIAR